MSHSIGEIWVNEKLVGYYEYNGTVDVCLAIIRKTKKEVYDHWRVYKIANCICNKPPIDAIIYSSYGNGFYWNGKVCLTCMCIIEGREPTDDLPGHPFIKEHQE